MQHKTDFDPESHASPQAYLDHAEEGGSKTQACHQARRSPTPGTKTESPPNAPPSTGTSLRCSPVIEKAAVDVRQITCRIPRTDQDSRRQTPSYSPHSIK